MCRNQAGIRVFLQNVEESNRSESRKLSDAKLVPCFYVEELVSKSRALI